LLRHALLHCFLPRSASYQRYRGVRRLASPILPILCLILFAGLVLFTPDVWRQ
jgi:hypothetical protein